MNEWFCRGRRIDTLPIDDRAVQYGDGVFETIAIRDARPRMLDRHVGRLRRGCERLGIEMPHESILDRDLQLALARTTLNTTFCIAKLIVSAGPGPRGYRRAGSGRSDALVGLYAAEPLQANAYEHGVETILTQSRIGTAPHLAGLKTLNRLDQVLARMEWDTDEIFDGIMRDTDDRVICGTMTNVFILRNNCIATPALDLCGVAGIMRNLVIDRLADNGIRCAEMDLGIEDLECADELFLCNSQIGAVPVRRCGALRWSVGEGTRSVMALLSYSGVPECGL